ncbi:hypothetical protein WK62_05375 [Burkholderia ubonensis]|uniref:hypothetical protein n=1 Tax=Burkholderia ubonensis TaxID=101571 RepID=UPI0007558ADD|nr:hypothetical protein [Burkholderia ubonensis]KVU10693.1 hypothetical protein WK62_05375 [Burkholderia ubonensis]
MNDQQQNRADALKSLELLGIEERFVAKYGHRLAQLLHINAFDISDRDAQIMGMLKDDQPAAAPADERAALESIREYGRANEDMWLVDKCNAALNARAAASPAAEAVAIPVEWDQDAAIEALSDFPKGSIWYEFLEEVGFDPTSGPIYVLTVQGRAMLDQLKSAYFAAPQPAQSDERAIEESDAPIGIYDGDTPESRAAFRDYDRRELARTRSKWQVWRDACAWQARAAASPDAEAVAYCVPNKKSGKPEWGKDWMFSPIRQGAATMPLYAAPQPAPADALDEEQRDALNEAICWANDDGLPGTADQLRSILALHAQADAPAETREPVCKLCRSTGPDVPCAYPTEINRQQAKRIAELEARLSAPADAGEAVASPGPGIYAWVGRGTAALVQIHKRPTEHSKGGVLNASVIKSSTFYDGCAVDEWTGGRWVGPLSPDSPPTARVASLTNEQIAATARQHATSFVDGDDAITDLFFEEESYLEFARALLNGADQS